MRKQKLLAIVLAVVIVLTGTVQNNLVTVTASESTNEQEISKSGTCGENLTWVLEGGTLTISGTGDMDNWDDYGSPWYNLDDITKVIIGEEVTSIGRKAFQYCSVLTSIEIPVSVTRIGHQAFEGCSELTGIEIPDSVTSIGYSVFAGCSGLASLSVDGRNPRYDSRNNCNAIIDTESNELIVGCKNTVIPSEVTRIGVGAFEGCSGLTSIEIPDSVTSIGYYAFSRCNGLTCIKIPNNVTIIEQDAFSGCSGLTSIEIPDSVTNIEQDAFLGCESLTSIEIPNSVDYIGYRAFCCSGLISINIPESVTFIHEEVFADCKRLTSITVDGRNPKYDSRNNCNAIIDTESNKLIVGCKNTVIPLGVTRIGESAFAGYSGLMSIEIPDSVTDIEKNAFYGCESLTSVKIPASVTNIGNRAFYGCKSLTSIKIPDSVTYIQQEAFYGCIGLTSIEIPNSVTGIGVDAFYVCKNLTIYGDVGSYAQTYANANGINFLQKGHIDVSESYYALAGEVENYLNNILMDQNFANGSIKGPSWNFEISGSKYTFTPLNFDFAAGMPLSNLKYQAVIDTDSKTVKVLLGVSKNGKSEIKQTTNVNSNSWGQQYQSIKKMYKDLTGYDAKTTRATWNNFEKMKSDLNNLKCDMFISADMKITGYLEFSYSEDDLKFKEGGVIEKVSVGTTLTSPVITPFVYISLGLDVSEEGTIKIKMNENVPELIMSLTLSAKASAKITGQIPVVAKVEGIIDATLSANFATTDPKFTVDMKGNITFKATALAGLIEIYENTWNYLDCQIYPEFVNKKENTISVFNSMDMMLSSADSTERIEDTQIVETTGINFIEENCYKQNNAQIIQLNNNRKMLLWLDDNEENSDNNRTSLMYSVYDGENWSEPDVVYEDGCFNGEFSYCVGDDQNLYIVYQKGNYIFDNDTEYTEMIRNIDPYMIVFDGDSFSEPVKIRDTNNSYEDNFELKYSDNNLSVFYEEYTSDYLAGNSNSMKILENTNNGETWEEGLIWKEEKFISDYRYVGNQLYVQLYNTDSGCYELYVVNDGTEEFVKNFSQEVSLQSDDKYLYYIDNNILTVMNLDSTLEYTLPYGTDYKVITNGERTKIVYEIINEDYSTELYSGDIVDGVLGEITLFTSQDRYIKTYNGSIDEIGDLNLAITLCTLCQDYTYEDYVLSVIAKEGKTSFTSTYLYYDENEVVAGNDLDLYYDVNNTGNEDISGYNVTLYDEAGNVLVNDQIKIDIKVGETIEQKLVYNLPVDFSEKNVYLQLKSMDDTIVYSEVETIIKHNDIEISDIEITQQCNQNYIIDCTVENIGYQKAKNISLTMKNHGNEIVKDYEISSLDVGEEYTETIVLTKEEYDALTNYELCVEAISSLSECNYENNTNIVDLSTATLDDGHNFVKDTENGKYICSICGTSLKYKVILTSTVDGADSSETVAMLTGGGEYDAGDEVTVTAPEKAGFTFKGWYEDGYTEAVALVSYKLVYTFTPEADTSLVAVYEPNTNITLNVSGDSNAYSVNGITQASNSYSQGFKAGSLITVKYTGNGTFCYWKNDSGKIVSRNQEYTFTLVSVTSLTAVAVGESTGSEETGYSALVEFVSYYGQVMEATTWNSKENASAKVMPTAPSKLGGTFKYWSLDGKTQATVETILAAINSSTIRITVMPVYEDSTDTYTVTVKYPSGLSKEDVVYDSQKLGDTLTVTADIIDGKTFAYWSEDSEGTTKLSYNDSYFIRISGNITLYAIYFNEEIEAEPVIAVTNIYRSEVDGKNKVSFETTRSVPDTYEVVETGVLGIIDGTYEESTSDMTVDSSTVKKAVSSSTSNNGIYTMNINVTGKLDTILAVRGYMIVKNKTTGNTSVIYTDIKTATYNAVQ